jgi:hypothetical protein
MGIKRGIKVAGMNQVWLKTSNQAQQSQEGEGINGPSPTEWRDGNCSVVASRTRP